MAFGRLKVDELETSTQVVDIDGLVSNGVSDGDKGDITVSGSGTVWSIDDGAVDTAALGGDITTAGKALLDDADAAAQRTTLGLAAVASTGAYSDLSGTPSIPAAADATPQPLGTAALGASTDYAREDHVHAMPSAADVGADPAGTASSAISSHVAAADPHPGYALESSLGGAALLNVGTTTGTVAAGDDNRFVPAGGTTGQALLKSSGTDYDASWQDITTAINDLTDVTITSVADGEVLTYDSTTGQWINVTPTVGGGTPGGTTGQLQWNSSGSFAGVGGSTVGATGDITLSLAGAASTPPLVLTGTWFSGGTSTSTKPQLLIEPTGTTSTAWSTSGTGLGINAASGFAGNLLDLQVDGSSKLEVDTTGTINGAIGFGSTYLEFLYAGTVRGIAGVDDGAAMFKLPGSGFFGWAPSTTINATYDLALFRDAANTLAQRNGTNAQTYRLYNTYADASNYERAYLRWASNVLEIGTEGAGTGSEQPVRITAATLKLPNLPTYADNTAATSGGLVAGDVYKTSTGELRITV